MRRLLLAAASSLMSMGLAASFVPSPSISRRAAAGARSGLRMVADSGLSRRSLVERSLGATAAAALGGTLSGGARRALASGASDVSMLELPDEAYTILGGDMKSCKILNGMWQLSGAHGYRAQAGPAVSDMRKYYESGFNTFDLADIYGPAEEITGAYQKQYGPKQGLFYTKWVPRPERISRAMAKDAIGRSLQRMDTSRLDLVQFHWWEYGYPYYMNALQYLQELQEDGAIRHLALTNFDTKHMAQVYDDGIKIVSNQVQYSILDQRPNTKMAKAAEERGIKILAYGTLLGGFFSEKWLGQAEPRGFETVSQQKYIQMIRGWGSWQLFQELLATLDSVAKKHKVSIPNVAVRWVLEQPAVGGAIVGVRFGLKGKEHLDDNASVFKFALDAQDKEDIAAVTRRGHDLLKVIGDCGDEYRRA